MNTSSKSTANKNLIFVLLHITFFLLTSSQVEAARIFGNLTVEKICRVHDGDTFIADIADVHPLIGSQVSIRIGGIDTPEITDKREEIKQLAIEARQYVINKLSNAKCVELLNVKRDKYFRILADVLIDDIDLADELIFHRLAKPYDGKTKPQW